MKRRDALKLIAAAAISSTLPRELWALSREVQEQLGGVAHLRTLNAHQDATVTTIAELILPQTDTPGAKAARVNEFIDLILTEWSEDEDRDRFLKGLADVDARSRELFGKDFVDCAPTQQTEIITELDADLARAREAIPPGTMNRGRTAVPDDHFFYNMKSLTLLGYYTSEVGAEQELQYEVIPTEHAACVPVNGGNATAGK
jgi:hypothetical protein